MTNIVTWPAGFNGKHEPELNDIETQAELEVYCQKIFQREIEDVAQEFGDHLVEEYVDDKRNALIQQHGDIHSPIVRKGLDITSAVDDALEALQFYNK